VSSWQRCPLREVPLFDAKHLSLVRFLRKEERRFRTKLSKFRRLASMNIEMVPDIKTQRTTIEKKHPSIPILKVIYTRYHI
jgi:hypothetical protein